MSSLVFPGEMGEGRAAAAAAGSSKIQGEGSQLSHPPPPLPQLPLAMAVRTALLAALGLYFALSQFSQPREHGKGGTARVRFSSQSSKRESPDTGPGPVGQPPSEQGPAAADRSNTSRAKLRLAVCILGQVGRTELDSKIRNLIEPNFETVDMHFFLILQPGDPAYSNEAPQTCKAAPGTLEEAKRRLEPLVRTTATESQRRPLTIYREQWGYNGRGAGDRGLRRMQNNLLQLLSWRDCARHVSRQEILDGGRMFDFVLRMRDNSLAVKPFLVLEQMRRVYRAQPSEILNYADLDEGSLDPTDRIPVMVKKCASWGGLNDKVMMVPRAHVDDALSGMADEYFLGTPSSNWTNTSNTEKYVKRILAERGVPVYREKPGKFPIVDARCEDGESFCVVTHKKDCRPKEPDEFPECSGNYFNPVVKRVIDEENPSESSSTSRNGIIVRLTSAEERRQRRRREYGKVAKDFARDSSHWTLVSKREG